MLLSDLNKTYKKITRQWLKALSIDDNDSLEFVFEKHPLINNLITMRNSSISTQKLNYSVLAKILKESDETNYKVYSEIATDLQKQCLELDKTNSIDKNEIKYYKTLPEIIEKRDQLYKDRFNSLRDNYKYLVLSLYTKTPPLRTEWRNMPLIKNGISDPDINQLLEILPAVKYIVYINNDKVSSSREPLTYDLPKELTNDIFQSLVHFPRKYVFASFIDFDKPLNEKSFQQVLNSLFGHSFGVRNLRSAYITDFYEKKKNILQKENLAKYMRHSREIAEISYNKIPSSEVIDIKIDLTKAIAKIYKNNNPEKSKQDSKTYYHAHRHAIRRRKLIKKGNEPNEYAPSKAKIIEYSLNYDESEKKWS
jgi:hypothetical protein